MRRLLFFMLGMLLISAQLLAQNRTITGRVTDDQGRPISNASVVVRGSNLGTVTSATGDFSLSVPSTARELVISFVGYAPQTLRIQNNLAVSLVADNSALNEVVVTGYTTSQRRNLTSSVSTVSGRAIANNPQSSIDNMLQGKATGVNIVRTNGRPGANAYIRIRGEGSISASNEPLFVVDGVAVPSDYYNALNPNDIEDISILKDAASASLYGARGANGVIVVTTRKGRAGTSGISYRVQYGQNTKTPDNFRLMNINEKLQYEYDLGYPNSYIADLMAQNGYASLNQVPMSVIQGWWAQLQSQNTDWSKVLLRNGTFMSNEISANGANERGSYFVSFRKRDEQGVGIGSYFNTYDGRMNASYKIRDWLTVGNNISISTQKYGALRDRYNAQNPFYAIYAYNPYEPVFNKDGSYNLTSQGFPIAEAVVNNPETQRFQKALTSSYLQFNIMPGLTFKSNFGIYYIDYTREYFLKPNSVLDIYVGDPAARGSKTDNGSRDFNYTWTNILTYDKKLSGKHNIGVTVVSEYIKDQYSTYTLSKKGFATGNLSTQDNGATVTAASTFKSEYALASALAEARYNFNEKYFFTGSFRRDGSSRFGANNRYGNFWSVSGAWNLMSENFMKNVSWFSLLKLRGSVGTAGNYQIGNYASLQLFGYSSYNNLTASTPTQVANPNLTWEKLRTYDIGTDWAIMKGRISGTIDYYNKKTYSLLLNRPLPGTAGFATLTENIGEMVNKGFEVGVSADIISNKNLTWNISANVSRNWNKITKLVNGADIPNGLTRFSVGRPKDTYYMVRWAGVDPANGNALYLDNTGKVTSTYSSSNSVFLDGKTPYPKYFGGLTSNLNYKGFSLLINFYFKQGSYTYNYIWNDLNSDGESVYQAQAADALNYWKKPGDVVPNPFPSGVSYSTDRFLQNSSYIRLRELTVGYNLSKTMVSRLHMKEFRIYVTGQNLWTATKFKGDPEVGIGSTESNLILPGQAAAYSYPNIRTIIVGANITF